MAAKTPEQWAAQIKRWRKGSAVKLRQALDAWIDAKSKTRTCSPWSRRWLSRERFRQDL